MQTTFPPKIPINQDQVRNLLRYIDETLDEGAKAAILARLGHECFQCGHAAEWIDSFKGDIQRFLDNVNVDHKSPFWEKLELTHNGTRLVLTGREVDRCVCAFTEDARPLRGLCAHCCTRYQTELFTHLFGKTVEVKVTESYAYGNTRCSTIVDIL
jgi:hypothetical protein